MAIQTKYFDNWLSKIPNSPDTVMAITGTTSGTGYWASVFAIRKNVKALLLLNRESPRVEEAVTKLQTEIKNSGSSTQLHTIACDLKSVESVKKAAEQVNLIAKNYGGLNVLANNAGFGPVNDTRSALGYDIQMQVNFYSHYLLAKHVFPSFDLALENGKEVRICQQTSGVRYMSKLPQEETFFLTSKAGTLGGDSPNAGLERYRQSKLACITFALKLGQMLEQRGYDTNKIKSLCSEPGFAETNLVTNSTADNSLFIKLLAKVVIRVMQLKMKRQSAADGSLTIAHASLAENILNGDFIQPNEFDVGTPAKSLSEGKLDHGKPEHEKFCLDPHNQELCWKMSEQAFGDFFEFAKK
ncbi:SDR family NAD(P)-dependent oxidoreductase [Marinibactrum halimedae]|uniref:Short-chain dehydrogenase n=1 Tax=Marinibactrum halimedae TaxID=1444977 RepID=A0AA37WNH7_9GAMM|nr:SDR family NAD(P)-dependent oxidoreductase [Marinibactrum halimedae]MCD9459389.1 SDR family NAD(P)-dependent oxidoreductase [Marinibactrum halimedae]GLS27545.1 short-chain dehydrogenase [Marinibactrum halimedae]